MKISKADIQTYWACAKSGNNANEVSFSGNKYYLDKYKAAHMLRAKDHKKYVDELIGDRRIPTTGSWIQFNSQDGKQYPWKIHLYSDDEKDWQKLTSAVAPYLKDVDATWKTLSDFKTVENLNQNQIQKGKTITIYPKSKNDFFKLAYELNYIIKNNKLQKENTSIVGDRQLGSSGRIFYRYELETKKYMDTVWDMDNPQKQEEYRANYRSNDGQYLAPDMSTADDPFYYYNPDTNSYEYPNYPQQYYQYQGQQGYQGYPDYQQF